MREFLVIGALLMGAYLWSGREIGRPAGVLVAEEPVQRQVYTSLLRQKNGYHIALLASFDIRARVIAAERYRFDRGAALSPVDLALGWGAMSDSDVLKQLSVSQGGRFYSWWVNEAYPVPRNVIESHSANMHMIPANDDIERTAKVAPCRQPGAYHWISGGSHQQGRLPLEKLVDTQRHRRGRLRVGVGRVARCLVRSSRQQNF